MIKYKDQISRQVAGSPRGGIIARYQSFSIKKYTRILVWSVRSGVNHKNTLYYKDIFNEYG